MICPECKGKNLKSIVMINNTTMTCMGWLPYYNEDGKYHSHNPNKISTSYICSNKHCFNMSALAPCPSCDYGVEKNETIS